MIGVDEAGKGAVLGPMVVAAVDLDKDLDLDIRDSKELTEGKRGYLCEEITRTCNYSCVVIQPTEVDDYVDEGRMNDLMVSAHSDAVKSIDSDAEVVVDAADVSSERHARRVSEMVGRDVEAYHKADRDYRCVAAASIVAKVERDRLIQEIPGETGSGYPSDPRTRRYLESHIEEHSHSPRFARESWSTVRDMLSEKANSSLDDY